MLFIKDKSGTVMKLSVKPSTSMANLKKKVQEAFDCPSNQQRLMFGKTILDEVEDVGVVLTGVSSQYPLTLQRLPAGGAKRMAIYSTQLDDYITFGLNITEDFTVQDTKEYIADECTIPMEDQWLELEMLDLPAHDWDAKPIAHLFSDFDLDSDLSLEGEGDVYSLIVHTVPVDLVKSLEARLQMVKDKDEMDKENVDSPWTAEAPQQKRTKTSS